MHHETATQRGARLFSPSRRVTLLHVKTATVCHSQSDQGQDARRREAAEPPPPPPKSPPLQGGAMAGGAFAAARGPGATGGDGGSGGALPSISAASSMVAASAGMSCASRTLSAPQRPHLGTPAAGARAEGHSGSRPRP